MKKSHTTKKFRRKGEIFCWSDWAICF